MSNVESLILEHLKGIIGDRPWFMFCCFELGPVDNHVSQMIAAVIATKEAKRSAH
jgi:hypothetical protein